jgi:D-xylose 1-dehydrogenase (NADP+, D-xylono-1,5-lactone-forming)
VRQAPLRLGILGVARIAVGAIIPAAEHTDAVEIAAVATRGGVKGAAVRELAPEAQIFDDYDALLASPDVDAIYVPLPNSLHAEWTLKAIAAGKHVLCEKPFALNAAEAERAVEAARDANLTLMEGFMYRFHPQMRRLGELVRGGAIGEVRQVVAEFGHRVDDPEDVRIIGSLGGGSLGDVGCYCVSGVRLAFGSEPKRATAFARYADDGADEELAGVLEFDGGLGFVSCSTSSARRERLEIVGTDGRVTLHAPFRADKAGGTLEISRGVELDAEHFETGAPYLAELEEFAAATREGREPAVGPAEILGNARAINALLDSAREGGEGRSLASL